MKIFLLLLTCVVFITGCDDDMNRDNYVFFSGKVENVKANGYAVDFDHESSDVFDLAIIIMDEPNYAKNREVEVVLDGEKSDAFVPGNEVSFMIPEDLALDFEDNVKSGSSVNFLYRSYMHDVVAQPREH